MSDTSPRPRALAFIYLTVVLDVLAFGIVVPVLPKLVASFLDNDTARASSMWGLFGSAYAAAQFLCSPILGALSDRFGRRPVILIALFGLATDYLVMAWAPTLAWLWLGRITSGICGATYSTAGAYIADVTPPEKRAGAFGLIGAAWGLGFVLGPAIGGFLGAHDPRLPFWAAGALTVANALYGLFVLPESLPPERRESFRWKRANPVGSLVLLRSHPELAGLAVVQTCYLLSHQVLPAVYVLYVGHRYGWSTERTSYVLALVGVASSIVQGALIRPFVRRLGERAAGLAGLASGALSSVLYATAASGGAFLLGIPSWAW
ncbi:MAG: MFS transporter [Gemmatimonadetes bacterium]|nr:MFS transporter [Gemmatimonadota bacterium]